MAAVITEDEMLQRKQSLVDAALRREDEAVVAEEATTSRYEYVKPLAAAAEGVLEAMENSDDRFRLGLAEVDVLTRGFGPKELICITGFSHAGKTQLINTAILNNADKRVLFFSMDDPAEMILLKLVCMSEGISAEVMEQRVRNHDNSAKLMLRQAASGTLANLIVIDSSLGLAAMTKAIAEATHYWGVPPDAVVIDYLASMAGDGHNDDEDGGVRAKVAGLKRWVKDKPFPTLVVHQQTRSKGGPGQPVTITSGAYGGEAEATILVGIRRKRDDEKLDQWERDQHRDTITLHVVKNKRPPARITHPQGIDFRMDPDTGLIRGMSSSEHGLRQGIERVKEEE